MKLAINGMDSSEKNRREEILDRIFFYGDLKDGSSGVRIKENLSDEDVSYLWDGLKFYLQEKTFWE